jgi:hypothetical protein
MNSANEMPPAEDRSSDGEDRVQDFLSRHGGASGRPTHRESVAELRGRWEISAADGYRLRCDWSRAGSRQEMQFSEIPP